MVFGLLKKLLSRYDGELKDGKRHGHGKYTYSNGNIYEGEWEEDQQSGQGTYTWGEGDFEGDRFIGKWKGGHRNGEGIYSWSDGRKYEGNWKDDNEHGCFMLEILLDRVINDGLVGG